MAKKASPTKARKSQRKVDTGKKKPGTKENLKWVGRQLKKTFSRKGYEALDREVQLMMEGPHGVTKRQAAAKRAKTQPKAKISKKSRATVAKARSKSKAKGKRKK